jgi:hypothetical protein
MVPSGEGAARVRVSPVAGIDAVIATHDQLRNGEKKISVIALQHYSISAPWQPKKGNKVLLTHPNLSPT